MGLGFQLTGRYEGKKGLLARAASPERFLKSVRRGFDESDWPHPVTTTLGQDDEGTPALWVQLHPAAEPLEIIAGPGEGQFTATARTSTVGPGYHVHLCEALRQIAADAGATFDPPASHDEDGGDETHYFHSRDRDACAWEFLRWLRAVGKLALEHPDSQLAISMPLEIGFKGDGLLVTPMGPRTLDWARATAADPQAGVDLFPWYDFGVNAAARLGYALHQMWCNVRWAAALTEDDQRTQLDVLANLEAAYREDPTLNYPWREWLELFDLTDPRHALAADVRRLADRAHTASRQSPIGYRRRPVVRRHPGGWSIRIPGHFVEAHDENDGHWRAFDEARTVHLSTYVCDRSRARTAQQVLDNGPPFEAAPLRRLNHRDGDVVARGVLRRYTDEGTNEERLQVQGLSAVTGRMALITIDFAEETDVDWAIELWKSVRNSNEKDE
jgi:hypothetical protein